MPPAALLWTLNIYFGVSPRNSTHTRFTHGCQVVDDVLLDNGNNFVVVEVVDKLNTFAFIRNGFTF